MSWETLWAVSGDSSVLLCEMMNYLCASEPWREVLTSYSLCALSELCISVWKYSEECLTRSSPRSQSRKSLFSTSNLIAHNENMTKMPNFKDVLGDIMSCLRRQLCFVMRNYELPLRLCALAWGSFLKNVSRWARQDRRAEKTYFQSLI